MDRNADLAFALPLSKVCGKVFNRTMFPFIAWSEVSQRAALDIMPGGLENPWFAWLLTTAAAHEFRHVAPFKLLDIADWQSYGKDNVINMKPAQRSLTNPDKYLYLDILARLESWGYRLQTCIEDAKAGLITYDYAVS